MMTMKSALITGAASGIGKACAERMAQEGYGVVVADVNLPAAEELAAKLAAEGLSAIAVHMDVADEQEVEGKARSLSLDLLDQWKGMEKDGKWRFTSPTHVVLAFSKALDELEAEGGIPARHRRYAENNRLLIEKMRAMGFAPYIDGSRQGPIITTFFYPAGVPFQFSEFYTYIKERGYVLYPGKLTDADTFRVGNIGEIYPEDIEKLASIIAGFLAAHKEEIA